MPKRDLCAALLDRHVVENAAPHARTDRTIGLRRQALDDRIRVLLDDAVWYADARKIFGQHVLGKIGLFLIQVDRQQVEFDRRAASYFHQQAQQRVTVLAAAQTDHDAVAFTDHSEIFDRFAHSAKQYFLQLFFSIYQ